MILLGIWGPKTLTTLAPKQSVSSSVMGGFYQGCFTFDFLAMVFYSRVIYQVALELLSHKVQNSSELPRKTFIFLLSSAAIAAVFFSLVYGGMMLAAAYNSGAVTVTSQEQLIAAFAAVLLGEKFAFLYTIIVTLACFATSFALLVVFADYVNMVSDGKIAYKQALVLSTLVAFGLANLNFGQITQLMGPLMIFIYPILIPMVLWVLAKKMAGR